MNSKSKKTKDKLLITLIVVVLLAAMTVVVGVVFRDKLKTLTGSTVTSVEANGMPRFMFDTAKFANWTTAGSTYTNPDDITDDFQGGKDDLPISSIVVTQCIDGSNCTVVQEKCKPWSDEKSACKELAKSTMNTNCFVMAFYNERKVNPEEEVAKYTERNRSFGSMTIQETSVKTLTMDTPEGRKDYKFHYYDYKNKGSDEIKRGNAIGYVALARGSIDVRSVCSEVRQLDETLPIIAAIRLEI